MSFLRHTNWSRTAVGSTWECYNYAIGFEGFSVSYMLHLYLDGTEINEASLFCIIFGGPFGSAKMSKVYAGKITETELRELVNKEVKRWEQ